MGHIIYQGGHDAVDVWLSTGVYARMTRGVQYAVPDVDEARLLLEGSDWNQGDDGAPSVDPTPVIPALREVAVDINSSTDGMLVKRDSTSQTGFSLAVGSTGVTRDVPSNILIAAGDTYASGWTDLTTTGGTVTTTVHSDQPFTLSIEETADQSTVQVLDSKAATQRGSLYLATLVASTLRRYARLKIQNTGASAQTSLEALRQVAQ